MEGVRSAALASLILTTAIVSITGCSSSSESGTVSYYTPSLVSITNQLAGTSTSLLAQLSPQNVTSQAIGDYMPWDAASYFRVVTNPGNISEGTVSNWAKNPAACQDGNIAPVDGTIYGFSCYLDSFIHGTTNGTNTCATSAGVTIYPRQILPFLSSWTSIPETSTVKTMNPGSNSSYTAVSAGASDPVNIAIYQGVELNGSIQILLGYRKTDSADFALLYFRTQDSGTPNINMNVVWGNTTTNEFESYAVSETSNQTTRVLSKGGYVFVQGWASNNPSGTPDRQLVGTSGAGPRCYSVETMKEVTMTSCETAMSGTAMSTDSQDALFRLKLINWTAVTALGGTHFNPATTNAFSGNTIPTTTGCL